MRQIWMLGLAAALLAGCQSQEAQEAADHSAKMQRTVGRERLLKSFTQVKPPSMNKEIMSRSDAEIISWIKELDVWTHQVLSSPVTGEMDRHAMKEMQNQLTQVYTPEVAQQLIDYFFRYDSTSGTYQAHSTRAMLGLRTEWSEYKLEKVQPADGQYKLHLRGTTKGDFAASMMEHDSSYQLKGDRLVVTSFITRS